MQKSKRDKKIVDALFRDTEEFYDIIYDQRIATSRGNVSNATHGTSLLKEERRRKIIEG